MKKRFSRLFMLVTAAILTVSMGMTAFANEKESPEKETESAESVDSGQSKGKKYTIPQGVIIGDVDVSGMTSEEALNAVDGYVSEVATKDLSLTYGEEKVTIPVSALGIELKDTSIIDDAVRIGQKGNLVKRYKELKDVANSGKTFDVPFSCDEAKVTAVVEDYTRDLNQEAVNATFSREDGEFKIVPEVVGRKILYGETAQAIKAVLEENFDPDNFTVELKAEEDVPEWTSENIGEISDVLGSYETVLGTGNNRIANIQNGTNMINGTIVMPGETFSVYEYVEPFNADNGYYLAGSYLNGRVVDSYGGGICQVSTTLYNAAIRAELEIVERSPHSMTVNYVPLSADAAISGTAKDLKFKNNLDNPIYIEGYTANGYLYFNIYGKETRPANRTIEFISSKDSTISPGADKVTEDPSKPEGYMEVVSSAHIGYVASLYKVVYVDGVEQSREKFNSSTYGAYPRQVIVGTASSAGGGGTDTPPATDPPATDPPATDPPATDPPATDPPATESPATETPPPVSE